MKQSVSKTQKILFVILGMAALYAGYDLSTGRKPVPAEKKKTADVISDVKNSLPTAAAKPTIGAIPVYPQWKRDPFAGKFESSLRLNVGKMIETMLMPKMANFDLTAISRSGKQSFAVINDEIVGIGESVNGFRVIEILNNAVVLKKNDYSFTITLPDESLDF
ncbi:MAG: hypothetical protein KDC45_06010 [Bacteroidetes bacterium]|nr:hypothetical protein [Bacteroidota bacterium]